MDYIKSIIDIIKHLKGKRFTGELVLTLFFNQGGIRSAEKIVKEKV
jgi:hypothetical protein